MASKVKKGFLYYIAWILFIVLGVVCILGCILIFNPGKDVLGINLKYVSCNYNYQINQAETVSGKKFFKNLPISTIDIDCGFSDVELTRNNVYENITIMVNTKISGFSSSDKIDHYVDVSFDFQTNTLKVAVTEPELSLALSPNAKIVVVCPKEYSFATYNFNITTKNGDIKLSTDDYYGVTVNSVDITSEKGDVYFDESLTVIGGNATINTKTSNIDINSNINSNLNITTESSKLSIEEITGNLNIAATELKANLGNILGNIKFSSQKGYININKVGGNFTEEEGKMHIANININQISGALTLSNAKSSDIKVGEIYGNTLIVTDGGNVTIGETHGSLDITTNSGAVSVTQTKNATSLIETVRGNISVNFLNAGQTTLLSEKANITINLKENLSAKITYKCAGKVSAGWVTDALKNEGTLDTPHISEASYSTINLTTKSAGNITIKNTLANE